MKSTPVQVKSVSGVQKIVVGGHYACGPRSDGTVWCWGHKYVEGQPAQSLQTATQVDFASNIKGLYSSGSNLLALRQDGVVLTWSMSAPSAAQAIPMPWDTQGTVTAVAAVQSGNARLVLRADGKWWGAGSNVKGEMPGGAVHGQRRGPGHFGPSRSDVSGHRLQIRLRPQRPKASPLLGLQLLRPTRQRQRLVDKAGRRGLGPVGWRRDSASTALPVTRQSLIRPRERAMKRAARLSTAGRNWP